MVEKSTNYLVKCDEKERYLNIYFWFWFDMMKFKIKREILNHVILN